MFSFWDVILVKPGDCTVVVSLLFVFVTVCFCFVIDASGSFAMLVPALDMALFFVGISLHISEVRNCSSLLLILFLSLLLILFWNRCSFWMSVGLLDECCSGVRLYSSRDCEVSLLLTPGMGRLLGFERKVKYQANEQSISSDSNNNEEDQVTTTMMDSRRDDNNTDDEQEVNQLLYDQWCKGLVIQDDKPSSSVAKIIVRRNNDYCHDDEGAQDDGNEKATSILHQ